MITFCRTTGCVPCHTQGKSIGVVDTKTASRRLPDSLLFIFAGRLLVNRQRLVGAESGRPDRNRVIQRQVEPCLRWIYPDQVHVATLGGIFDGRDSAQIIAAR